MGKNSRFTETISALGIAGGGLGDTKKGDENMSTYNPNEYSPSYGGQIDSNGNIKNIADAITGTGSDTKLKVDIGSTNVSLNASDVQIGAVEIKNGQATSPADEYRMTVNSDGSLNMHIVGSINGGVWS